MRRVGDHQAARGRNVKEVEGGRARHARQQAERQPPVDRHQQAPADAKHREAAVTRERAHDLHDQSSDKSTPRTPASSHGTPSSAADAQRLPTLDITSASGSSTGRRSQGSPLRRARPADLPRTNPQPGSRRSSVGRRDAVFLRDGTYEKPTTPCLGLAAIIFIKMERVVVLGRGAAGKSTAAIRLGAAHRAARHRAG